MGACECHDAAHTDRSLTDQGGGKRRGSGLSIIAQSLTGDCKPRKAKGATQTLREETPAGVRDQTEVSPCVAGGSISGGSLKPGAG
jgi:hypothetical protein